MKLLYYLTIIVVFVCVSGDLNAENVKYAIGINLADFFTEPYELGFAPDDLYDIPQYPVLHWTISNELMRIDPEISFWRCARTRVNSREGYSDEKSSVVFHAGLGVCGYLDKSEKANTYTGVKLGLDFLKSTTRTGSEENIKYINSKRNLYLGPCIGTEILLTDRLALGGEFQALYYFTSEKEETNKKPMNKDSDDSKSLMKTRGLVFLRWYFK